ncbi:MAG: peptidoglycan DD-metalloendopeptidase family protein [Chitinophagales bacterium]|nr:peptidoglycan DD-metalloendopeptidase family protein [Chitinophagales bacterium]
MISASTLNAQNQKKKLQSEYDKILKEIVQIEESIKKTRDQKIENISLVNSLNAKIKSRASLLSNITSQMSALEKELNKTNHLITSLEEDIKQLKSDYARMVYNTYKYHQTVDPMTFIFSSESFNQAFQRLNYLRKFSSFRKQQSDMIGRTINDLSEKEKELIQKKSEQAELFALQEGQKQQLEREKGELNKMITKFSKDEESLKKKVAQKNQDAEALNKRIQKIIEEEIRLARERAAAAAAAKAAKEKEKSKSSGTLALTPKEQALSNNFSNNKRKLPWPVDRGYIIEKFGKQPHPTVKGVFIDANGIGIKTEESADVNAIFDGTVVSVFYMPSEQNSVIIKHGDYFTVYSNLMTVNVKKGDQVKTKGSIGKAFTDENEKVTKVNLQIWKGTLKLNPELWLAAFN